MENYMVIMVNEIVVDTNFFLSCIDFGISFEQLRQFSDNIVVLDVCFQELQKLLQQKGKKARMAAAASRIIKKERVKVKKSEGSCDKAIIAYAKNHKCYVATNDRELLENLKKFGIKIIRIRQKKYLVIE